ncbi:hypothetical protein BDZ45DRAFT_692217 [Acephala macrosclerotiorum]|nr:hypothetical protein BDZ45DRAFT_692217 [Acephala macrosclerotiorum]
MSPWLIVLSVQQACLFLHSGGIEARVTGFAVSSHEEVTKALKTICAAIGFDQAMQILKSLNPVQHSFPTAVTSQGPTTFTHYPNMQSFPGCHYSDTFNICRVIESAGNRIRTLERENRIRNERESDSQYTLTVNQKPSPRKIKPPPPRYKKDELLFMTGMPGRLARKSPRIGVNDC